MIEVEAKFSPEKVDMKAILENSQFISEKTIQDVYYDHHDLSLMKKDWWLRKRNGSWQLKCAGGIHGRNFSYEEYENIDVITDKINTPITNVEASWRIVYRMTTHRKTYRKGDVTIDIDTATSDNNFKYILGEIEVVGNNEASAQQKVHAFLKEHNMEKFDTLGKGILYAKLHDPEVYQVMQEYLRRN